MMESNTPMWYAGDLGTEPFRLARTFSLDDPDSQPFLCTAAWPWPKSTSMDAFVERSKTNDIYYDELQVRWKKVQAEWLGSIIVGSIGKVYIFPGIDQRSPICLDVPGAPSSRDQPKQESWKVQCVAWAMQPGTWHPVAVIAASRTLFIYDVVDARTVGRIRGHGRDITSIAIHPSAPYMFTTTSKDQTTRLYSLEYPSHGPRKPMNNPSKSRRGSRGRTTASISHSPDPQGRYAPDNPHWPPFKQPSLAGPSYGLHMSQEEGDGQGRCIGVLAGGRSGGHEAGVLCAAWDPSGRLIATCGMDHAVKIWRMPLYDERALTEKREYLAREDKPIFSTDLIHSSRVLSVAWLSDDILISYSAPALMRGGDEKHMYYNAGTVVVWQWLGYDRFYRAVERGQKVVRGCASDYKRSESFKILSLYSLPKENPYLHIYAHRPHHPILVIPKGKTIQLYNITHFSSRPTPPFPQDAPKQALQENDNTIDDAQTWEEDKADEDDIDQEERSKNDEGGDDDNIPKIGYPREPEPIALLENVRGWQIKTEGLPNRAGADVEKCEIVFNGKAILGIGKSTLYFWRREIS